MKFVPISLAMSLLLMAPANAEGNTLEPSANGSLVGQGQLAESDNKTPRGRYFDTWSFYAEAGETISIVVESSDFDTVAVLLNIEGEPILSNDDLNSETTNSQLDIDVTQGGEFILGVLSYDGSGLGTYSVGVRKVGTSQSTETTRMLEQALEQAQQLNRVLGVGSSTLPNDPGWTP
ncbi:MAG: PPC domain-containing protein [Phormidesmis sp.]